MSLPQSRRVGYVLEYYPLYAETLVIKEMLAHEAGGLEIEFFALHPRSNPHPQTSIAQRRAADVYGRLPSQVRISEALNTLPSTATGFFWAELQEAGKDLPGFWAMLESAQGESAGTVYQATWLARKVRRKGIAHLHTYLSSVTTSITGLAAHFADIPYTLHSSSQRQMYSKV